MVRRRIASASLEYGQEPYLSICIDVLQDLKRSGEFGRRSRVSIAQPWKALHGGQGYRRRSALLFPRTSMILSSLPTQVT